MPILKWTKKALKKRPTLFLRKPLVAWLPNIILGGGEEVPWRPILVDEEIRRMRSEKEAEWRGKGYPNHLIAMALDLAQGWARRMSAFAAPVEIPGAREAIYRQIYPTALKTADEWIRRMAEAAGYAS